MTNERSSQPLRVPFGFRGGVLYEPRQVENGKRCDCVCPACKRPLIARQNVATPHFAHAPGEDCARGLETAVHLAAKQLVAERMVLALPPVRCWIPGGFGERDGFEELEGSRLARLSGVRLEPWSDGIRPDIIAIENGVELLVEIAVTHFCDGRKVGSIVGRKISGIEFDLSTARQSMNFEVLAQMLFRVPSDGYWLYHPRIEEHRARVLAERERRFEERSVLEQNVTQRYSSYCELPDAEKLRRNIKKAGLTQRQSRALTAYVSGDTFYVKDWLVWQTAILAYVANNCDESAKNRQPPVVVFQDIEWWLSNLFETRFTSELEYSAIWNYLVHLESLGLLKREISVSRTFGILMRPSEM